MSEFREDLFVSSFDKKRVIKTILVVGLLISLFAFSSVLFSLLWGSQRLTPSDQLSQAEWEDAELIDIPLTINFSDLLDLFDNLTLTPDQIESALDAIEDMFDGNIDDMDLGDFAAAALGLAASNIEVFRIYHDENYDIDIVKFYDTLWKYECFDEYNGSGWQSTAGKQNYNYYSYADYYANPPLEEILKVQMPLSPSAGKNSMVIPNLFPTPYIMENSLTAANNYSVNTLDLGQTDLYKDDFNCTTLDPYFINADPVNMTYKMFGLNLPTDHQINMSAVEASYTRAELRNKYLKLPPSINVYRINNPNFNTHFKILNQTIFNYDNAFQVASKIKNYLQSRFTLNYNPAPTGRDAVDWFCETGSGMPSDFASAFCAFTRSFGVVSRFVNGFNSFNITKEFDSIKGQHYFSIKYRNLYNWAEVYIPFDNYGNGRWIQMDAFPLPSNYTLSLYSNFTSGDRGAIAELTAHLELNNNPVSGRIIYFYDEYYNEYIGQASTDLNGNASIFINIDNSQIVGPHAIAAYYGGASDFISYMVHGDIEVTLTSINPANVTLPIYTNTFVQGYVSDPINNERVRYVTVEFLLLEKGTNIRPSLTPFVEYPFVDTDDLGQFNINLNVDSSVPNGKYDFRVDVNNTWSGIFYPLGNMYNSSNLLDFNVSRGIIKKLLFYINGVPSNIPEYPEVNRLSSLQLTALVLNETNAPIANQNIEFHDFTQGIIIGSNITNSNGIATWDYALGINNIAGPNLLFIKLNSLENYSYFVLNEEPEINIYFGPVPREINRTTAGATNTQFRIAGNITDGTNGNPLRFSTLTLKLFKSGLDYWYDILPSDIIWTDFNGNFDYFFEVDSDIPTGNYTLRMDFNGTIDFSWMTPFPYFFNLPNFNTSTSFQNELKVNTPSNLLFNFWINGTTSNQYQQPIILRNGDLNLSVFLQWGPDPIGDGEMIEFYDETQDLSIGFVSTSNGRASLIYSTGVATIAGPHLISSRWGSNYNYSYFILNDQINVTLLSGPAPREIYRSGSTQRTFSLQGSIIDGSNGSPIKFPQIQVFLLDETMTDVSYYLSTNIFQLNNTGVFDLSISVSSGTPAKNYTLGVGFNGVFIYSFPNNQFNEHDFYLLTTNFTDYKSGYYELKIIDPDDISILLSIDGNPTLSFYNDFNLPERYSPGDIINFSVYITQSGTPVTSGTVVLRDVYIGSQIGSYDYILADNGYHEFTINTASWHAGLHKIEVQWSTFLAFNTTYIIINKTITISAYSSVYHIQRDFDMFSIFGSVQDGTVNLRGLNIKIILFNSDNIDVSGYLNLAGSQIINVYDGSYQFNVNFISLNCPQDQYYFRIDFNGSINEAGISLSNYMIHTSSMPVSVNVTAGTYITGNYDTQTVKDQFYEGDTLYAYGYLRWDNGTAITGKEITITIKDSYGVTITSATGFTDGSGWFNISILIGNWPNDAEVLASFDPEDNYIDPYYYYIEYTERELFR